MEKTNRKSEKPDDRNLLAYYKSLPAPTYPKKEFTKRIALETGVSEATVRNWILGVTYPDDVKNIKILSDLTGIPIPDLWSGIEKRDDFIEQ